jgi:hypothetical protein
MNKAQFNAKYHYRLAMPDAGKCPACKYSTMKDGKPMRCGKPQRTMSVMVQRNHTCDLWKSQEMIR